MVTGTVGARAGTAAPVAAVPVAAAPVAAAPPDVRSRARAAVKTEVARVAIDLFLDRGFEQTTVEEIADAAGMSRATFFRYFRTKEDVVLDQATDLGLRIRDALAARPGSEAPWPALRRALEVVVETHTLHRDTILRVIEMMTQTPSIRARHHEKTIAWQEALIPEVARRLHTSADARNDPRPAAVVACALSCLDEAMRSWAGDPAGPDLGQLLDAAMCAVGPT